MAPIQELLAPQAYCRKKEISLVASPVLSKNVTSVDALSDAQKDVRFVRARTGKYARARTRLRLHPSSLQERCLWSYLLVPRRIE